MVEHRPVSEHLIGIVGDLPALPSVVAEVLRATDDPSTSTADVSAIIQRDPALTAKVLRVSNSSYYGMKQYVGTLKLALVILGVREIRNIVLGISVFESLNDQAGDMRLAQDIWAGSLRTAGVCKKLADTIGLGLRGEEFIVGLLADIGIMGMLRKDGDGVYRALYESTGHDLAVLRRAEMLQFQYDHAMAAQAMAMQWSFPRTLSDALGVQYPGEGRSLREAKDPRLAAVIRIAKAIDCRADGEKCVAGALEEDEAWAILAEARNPVAPGDRERLLLEFVGELEAVPVVPL